MNDTETINFEPKCTSPKRIRTLVVDDSPMATGAIRVLLESKREIELIGIARNGEDGVSQAEDLEPDLILMDLQMPKLDGLSATRLIRTRLPNIRVIIITVNHGQEVRQQCANSGADGFVVKDRLYRDLFGEIQRVFDGPMTGHDTPLNTG